jgi:hypothetical protein
VVIPSLGTAIPTAGINTEARNAFDGSLPTTDFNDVVKRESQITHGYRDHASQNFIDDRAQRFRLIDADFLFAARR